MDSPLAGKVALVAGATRGTGRGIAVSLAEAGAIVYGTGRSSRADGSARGQGSGSPFDLARRPETIEETADIIAALGGTAIPIKVDHTDGEQVQALVARIEREQGRLDILVNDIWGGDELTEWGRPFWELDAAKGLLMVDRVLRTHVLTLRHAVPLMRKGGAGLVVEVTDGDFLGYRGHFFYDMAKLVPIRLAYAMAADFDSYRSDGLTALAVTPGFIRSEAMLDHFGVTEANWRDAVKTEPHFAESETPRYIGRGVAALAADPRVTKKAGSVLSSATLAIEYDLQDIDGRQPDFARYLDGLLTQILDRGEPLGDDERGLVRARYYQLHLDPSRAAETKRMAAALGTVAVGALGS